MSELEQIRQRVEATHAEALRALLVLQKYVDTEGNLPGSKNDKHKTNGQATKKPRVKRAGTISARVLAVIATEWASVDAINAKTSIDKKQIRGVLLSPRFKQGIEKRETDGLMEYRTKQKQGEQGKNF